MLLTKYDQKIGQIHSFSEEIKLFHVDPLDAHKNKTICGLKKCFCIKTALENAKLVVLFAFH